MHAQLSKRSGSDTKVGCLHGQRAWACAWAWSRAPRMTSCWEGPLGAVRELDLPSWFTNVPRSTTAAVGPSKAGSSSALR